MNWTIDRIEKNLAILENRKTLKMIEVPTSILPNDIHEGSILKYEKNQYTILEEEEKKKRKEIEERFQRLRNN